MRWVVVAALALLVACKSSEAPPAPAPAPAPASKPPDQMDEKMRHCPLALDGASSILEDIDGGVRFTVTVPQAAVAEARRRAHHIVDFAAKRSRDGHGEFDGKGGGRMKNCPVVTDQVGITVVGQPSGVQIDITAGADRVATLRAESRARAEAFPFVGASVTVR